MSDVYLSRRAILAGTAATAAAGATLAAPRVARAGDTPAAGATEPFAYEVTRSEGEWRARLSKKEYEILRDGGTEFPTTSPYWNTNDPGTYHCKGCDLPLYSSEHYSPQKIGFVFFDHSFPNAVLTGIHTDDYNGSLPQPKVFMEVHCRRCGSHLGHIVTVKGKPLHCINGTALKLEDAAAA